MSSPLHDPVTVLYFVQTLDVILQDAGGIKILNLSFFKFFPSPFIIEEVLILLLVVANDTANIQGHFSRQIQKPGHSLG